MTHQRRRFAAINWCAVAEHTPGCDSRGTEVKPMGEVNVVDRGSREIVVFLSGDIDDGMVELLRGAVEEVAQMERLNGLSHAVVDMHGVTALGEPGLAFLRDLSDRGRHRGFEVSFSALSGPAHRAVEAAGWPFMEPSPPPG
jgi:anti-anti-sigma regulatory factor